MKKILYVFLILFSLCAFSQEILYSEKYFNDLIEPSQDIEQLPKNDIFQLKEQNDEIGLFEQKDAENRELEVFKLKIEANDVEKYVETFKKDDSKTSIYLGKNLSFVQDALKYRNKYNSNDYKIVAGVEFAPIKHINLASGLEANYSGFNQDAMSRKVYFSPMVQFSDVFSLQFHNKMNVVSGSTDHDIGVKISPFKAKNADFRVYMGYTRKQSGANSKSVNFSTNFYLF